jgi:site-specific DNA recombinase
MSEYRCNGKRNLKPPSNSSSGCSLMSRKRGASLLPENIYKDDGFSGSRLSRPDLDQLRDKVQRGEVDRLLMTAPDRLARKYVHQVLLLEEMEGAGCKVCFLDRAMSEDPHD